MVKEAPKCKIGFPCGKSCISRTKNCYANLSSKDNKVAETFSQFVNRLVGIGNNTQSELNTNTKESPEPEIEDSNLMKPNEEMEKSLVEYFYNSPYFQKKLEKVKSEYGLDDLEAMGIAMWISDSYSGMNNLLYNEYTEEDLEEEDYKYVAANYYADKAIRSGKIPAFSEEGMQELQDKNNYSFEGFNESGRLSRGINGLPKSVKKSLINKYRNNIGEEIEEEIFFATTAFAPEEFAFTQDADILFEIIPKKNTSGVMVDGAKNELFEGEVLFKPKTKFKVLEAQEDIQSLSNLSVNRISEMAKSDAIKEVSKVLDISDLEDYNLLDISKAAYNLKDYGSRDLTEFTDILMDRFPFLSKEKIEQLFNMNFNPEIKDIINEIESKGGIFIEKVFKIVMEEV